MVLIGAILLNMFVGSASGYIWIAAIGVLVFSGLLVFDTWRMRNVYGPDDYVMAAVSIYLDLLNMFLFLLVGGQKRGPGQQASRPGQGPGPLPPATSPTVYGLPSTAYSPFASLTHSPCPSPSPARRHSP